MARGKYLSLEEARRQGKLDQFAKEHPKRDLTLGTLRVIEKQATYV